MSVYKKILVPLENSSTDQVILEHLRPLAKLCESKIVLVHVADGFVARNQSALNLSESVEMKNDREYLERIAASLISEGIETTYSLLCGEPADQLLKLLDRDNFDLIAMATHGHGLLGDIVLGSVAEKVRHRTQIPILMLRAPD